MRYAADGLVPCIVQDAATGEVIMLAYANQLALTKTFETGETHFWSRSRQELWHKGAGSGNVQRVVRVALDCDHDAVLVQVHPAGPACHTEAVGCFRDEASGAASGAPSGDAADVPPFQILSELAKVIAGRAAEAPEGSYTARLLADQDLALKKIGEEATEVVLAAKGGDQAQLVYESADLLYHLLVALQAADVPLTDVWAELASRRH